MTQQTSDIDIMPRQARTSEVTSNIRMFEDDYQLAVEIKRTTQPQFRLSLQDIIREAIHAGLPLVRKKYEAAVEAAAKVKG